jgi:hypothetical protein
MTATWSAISAMMPRSWVMKIMRHAPAIAQFPQQVENLGLHGHIQGGGGLVGD